MPTGVTVTEKTPQRSPKIQRPLDNPDGPLQRLLEVSAKRFPEKNAVIYGDCTVSYSELDSMCTQFSKSLCALGIKKGSCVALYLPNIPQFVVSYFGALKAGAAVTTINPLHREREVEFQLCDSEAKMIVTLDSLRGVVDNVSKKTSIKHIITTAMDALGFPYQPTLNSPEKFEVEPSKDLAALQYTGGTTGTAKAAMLTHRNLASNAHQFATAIDAHPEDVFLTVLPLFHIYGLTTSMTVPISVGATIVLSTKFEPVKACQVIQRHKVTVFCGVPTMYQMLLATPERSNYDLSSVRVCISGAASLPPQVQKQFMAVTGGFLAEGYGLSEASPVTHCSPVDRSLGLRVGSIGLPLPDTEARIVDLETGEKTLDVEGVGELSVKGPQVMLGYWKRPDETTAVLRNGWLLTGDIARVEADGYFYIVDRKKDLIKRNGYSIYPRELEDILYEHPAVKYAAVVGKPDAKVGENPNAYVVLKDGAVVSEDALMAFVNEKIAAYKAIREVRFLREMPFGSAGKVLKRKLRELP